MKEEEDTDIKDELESDMKDGLESDIKDNLEPLVNKEFKDEFTDELEAETTLELSGVGDQMEIGDQELIMTDDQPEQDPLEDGLEAEMEDPIGGLEGEAEEIEDVEDAEEINGDEQDETVALDGDDEDDGEPELVEGVDLEGGGDEGEVVEAEGEEGEVVEAEGEEGGVVEAEGEEGEVVETEGEEKDPLSSPGGTKRKAEEKEGEEVAVRKSTRIKQISDLRKEKEDGVLQGKSVHDMQIERTKMLQKPTERPIVIDDDSEPEKISDTEKDDDIIEIVKDTTEGDRSRPPGADAKRKIDIDFLLPFKFGWTREVVYRTVKTGPAQADIFYWPPKGGEDHGHRNKEAKRKRRSKVDQERYFEEFTHSILSVLNFSYVRRPLDLNNKAYEIVRHAKPGLETRSNKRTRKGRDKVQSYKEVAEHEGLLSSGGSDDEGGGGGGGGSDGEIEDITDFDQGLPLSLQILRRVTPMREETKKRHKFEYRDRCITPPLAEDLHWTLLDDDPLGIYTELGGRSSPATPPPLRAVRLTAHPTVDAITNKFNQIKSELPDPLVRILEGHKDMDLKENLATHDAAIKKYKDFKPKVPLQARNAVGRPSNKHQHQRGPARASQPVGRPSNSAAGFVKVRLPMISTNGKRPVVELVMLTNGKYQPIKFTNNRQVTESIPKRLFDQANGMKKTLYQRSVQVPKIGTKQVFVAINPGPAPTGVIQGATRPPAYAKTNGTPPVPQSRVQQQAKPVGDQVSVLVRPAQGGNAVLLNVPRHVALKVKIGTTLSFSASNEQKYTVIDNKMHAPVGKNRTPPAPPHNRTPNHNRAPNNRTPNSGGRPNNRPSPTGNRPGPLPNRQPLPQLPAGVSIRPVNRSSPGNNRPRPPQVRAPPPLTRPSPKQRQRQSGGPSMSNFSPCSPFCPGVTGIPELECNSCHSLFHPVCVGIPQARIHQLSQSFRCKGCGTSSSGKSIQVIDLD